MVEGALIIAEEVSVAIEMVGMDSVVVYGAMKEDEESATWVVPFMLASNELMALLAVLIS